jgi:uncharacterized protein YllA (UPF0747 family)
MNDLQKAKLEMWKKKLGEANAFLSEALKKKSESMKVGYLSENAYKVSIEEIEIAHARIEDINRIISSLETVNGTSNSTNSGHSF